MDTSDDRWWFNEEPHANALPARLSKSALGLSETQRVELERLIMDMVAWEPDARISAAEVVRRPGRLAGGVSGCCPRKPDESRPYPTTNDGFSRGHSVAWSRINVGFSHIQSLSCVTKLERGVGGGRVKRKRKQGRLGVPDILFRMYL
ncbi:uncharacterized protein B0H64DRAFT_409610 [Chaetomium fimeti]|uniref:Uncharacterized protein n=1 Tax=Chaetomium fimeti TaxID=1854472 RepID=A0AAE0H7W8_9PEZI|nr:hypothetical protein B0H64DRAFT_409610 [Chaetomium fimeti]